MTRASRRAVLATPLALIAPPALAQRDWPTHTVRFIGLFPPGGGTDILSRIWCARIAEVTGQQFVVENRSGMGGNIGTEAIARAAPDGRTIGLASVAPLAISPSLYASLPFDVNRDLTYIAGLWHLPNLLVVTNDLPVRTVPELIALLKANPGKYTYASAGAGTSLHIAGAMFATMAGVDITHVPYRGGTGVQMDLVAGRVHMMFDNIPSASVLAKDGRVRALAVTGAERSALMPEIPPMKDFLPGFEITSWGGVIGPAGLPPALVGRIAALAKQALQSEEVLRRYAEAGASPWPAGPEELASFRAANERAFAPIIKASGARVD